MLLPKRSPLPLVQALYPEASPADLRTLQAMSASRKSRIAAAAAEAAANDKLLAEIQVREGNARLPTCTRLHGSGAGV